MNNFLEIFSILILIAALIITIKNIKGRKDFGDSVFTGKVKTKSKNKYIFGVFAVIMIIRFIMTINSFGLNTYTVMNLTIIFYLCSFVYFEHNAFRINDKGILVNQIITEWKDVESFNWNGNKLIIRIDKSGIKMNAVVIVEYDSVGELIKIIKQYKK
ncbi:DUF5673 domain-containing protein [Oceanirhabdus sp. W0125-5]|uniref:DUF5673 domain-containing protein n=1 Tax=Oceanirhabdus sp. W0125-5 TaxID=2999116 RepID=UPI0022F2B623|nr:DUF5673 domain-containing protein [Oceanirhabdus sp. W0125-5]WBW95525.1 DUF5673 domain-containing protein [Oceanirhabdus sp. W0125-5]